VSYVNIPKLIKTLHPNLVTIKGNISLSKILSKIKKTKNIDYVWVQKPKINQMSAVLMSRILGKKFFWIQNFDNPPVPNFLSRLLISQADNIIVAGKREFAKIKNMGVDKSKIKIQR